MLGWKSVAALAALCLALTGAFVGWRNNASEQLAKEIAKAREIAQAKLEENPAEARAALEAVWDKLETPDAATMRLMAVALEGEGRLDRAAKAWERLDAAHPKHEWKAESLAGRAALAIRDKDLVVARDFYEQAAALDPDSEAGLRARAGLLEIAYRDGSADEALALGYQLIDTPDLKGADRERVERMIGDLNLKALFSPQIGPGDEIYEVQRGDYIQKIAQVNDATQEVILRANNISDPRTLSVGKKLKVSKRAFAIEVDKFENTLTVTANGKFFKRYRCRTGRADHMTPTGEYKIINKKKDPEWRKPGTGEFVASGAPDNELGTRWMAFDGSSLGIHGTIDPSTVGFYASQGCVGMLKEDVEELFDYIPLGTPLSIRGTQNPELKLPERIN